MVPVIILVLFLVLFLVIVLFVLLSPWKILMLSTNCQVFYLNPANGRRFVLLDNNLSNSIPARVLLWLISTTNIIEISHNKTLAGIECDLLLSYEKNRLPFAVIELVKLKKPGNSWESLDLIWGENEEDEDVIEISHNKTLAGMEFDRLLTVTTTDISLSALWSSPEKLVSQNFSGTASITLSRTSSRETVQTSVWS